MTPTMTTAHVEYAYSPRQNTGARGKYHLVLDQHLASGRLHREAGNVLCKPNHSFWGLEPRSDAEADCPTCLRLAAAHGVTAPKVDSWS